MHVYLYRRDGSSKLFPSRSVRADENEETAVQAKTISVGYDSLAQSRKIIRGHHCQAPA